ncbi:MAG: methyltransferase domain-containing protein [Kiloniellaceae bacterium]
MSGSADDRRTVEVFSTSLRRHGQDYRALNWGSREGQENRFRVLCEIGLDAGDSLLDVGCGLGDLHDYLNRRGIAAAYSGIDITPDMVAAAAQRFPAATFHCASLLGGFEAPADGFDYVFASGIFYLREEHPFDHLKASVARMFHHCRKGVAFNCLSGWGEANPGGGEYREDPLRCLAFCRTLTPWVVLRHDYHPGDFTLYLRKGAQRS